MSFDTAILDKLGAVKMPEKKEGDDKIISEIMQNVKKYTDAKDLKGLKRYLTHAKNELRTNNK